MEKTMVTVKGKQVEVSKLSPADLMSLNAVDKITAFEFFGIPVTDEMREQVRKEKVSCLENLVSDISKLVTENGIEMTESEITPYVNLAFEMKSGSDISRIHAVTNILEKVMKNSTLTDFTPINKTPKSVNGTKTVIKVAPYKAKELSEEKRHASLKRAVFVAEEKVNSINKMKEAKLSIRDGAEENAKQALKKAKDALAAFEKENK